MAKARITRGDQVVEVDGITAAAAYELARQFAAETTDAGGDQDHEDAPAHPFGFTFTDESVSH